MPEDINDFINRFGSDDAVSDEQAMQQYYQRLSTQAPKEEDFANPQIHQGATEYLGKLPDDQFQKAAGSAYSQMEPEQQQDVVAGLLAALKQAGVNVGALTGSLGMESTDPQKMSTEDYTRLANYTRQEHPEAMQQVMADKPMWLKALGHPVILGALGMLASRWLQKNQQQRNQ